MVDERLRVEMSVRCADELDNGRVASDRTPADSRCRDEDFRLYATSDESKALESNGLSKM